MFASTSPVKDAFCVLDITVDAGSFHTYVAPGIAVQVKVTSLCVQATAWTIEALKARLHGWAKTPVGKRNKDEKKHADFNDICLALY